MVDTESNVFNLDSALVITRILIDLSRNTWLGFDALVALEEHRYRLIVLYNNQHGLMKLIKCLICVRKK